MQTSVLAGLRFHTCRVRHRGFRNALIWTSVDNYRGQAFYSNFGFAVEEPPDWTHKFVKELPSPEPEPEPSSSSDDDY